MGYSGGMAPVHPPGSPIASPFFPERVCLIVTGGIAAYKAPDIVRRLRERGTEVRVVMTTAAQAFVQPLVFQAVSGQPVHTSLLDPAAEAAMGHIELARWADTVLVAPASADFLARLAAGLADDLATTLCLATEAPLVVAPAMNRLMWAAPATRANCALLANRGVRMLGPGEGAQACGETGAGRMLEPTDIVAALAVPAGGPLTGLRVLLTAGPTQEAIDPVRVITNRSSGKMGYAVARAARAAGAEVCLVSGPTRLDAPSGVRRVAVTSAAEMHAAVMAEVDACDIFIATAAVADYTLEAAEHKVKKQGRDLVLTLSPTVDILAAVAAQPTPPFTVGFAAETRDLLTYARDKLTRKRLHMVAANLVGQPGTGFDADENELQVVWPEGECALGRASKDELAARLIALVGERFRAVQKP
jgi:phosphopantothenoylcysteine decarboxylase/phosphopantothenate--cysteine ligase